MPVGTQLTARALAVIDLDHVQEVHPFFAGAYLLRVEDRDRSEVLVSCARAGRERGLRDI